MEKKEYDIDQTTSKVQETFVPYEKQEEHETLRRRQAILMTDEEKFKLFCRMLKRGIMFKRAVITHKK
ncbi:MAG: hypothetical protein KA160_00935 [Lacibacter sp.]|nr:hypothetical protein [Lacibacter sp.]